MDSDIEFGEIRQDQPTQRRRPDRSHLYAVRAIFAPAIEDLPIFVDLDVMCEIEDHALDDLSVELGGVLIGGQYLDEQGKPFVQITDSLRAEHYENTQGSFKFTHQTWTELTRKLQSYPADQRIVGWYHTHPNWGVFLSGLDLFICDHFFNQPLDLALVIDPCRQDRGFFQWTGESQQRIRRTGGFYLMTSRLRAVELDEVAMMYEQMGSSERATQGAREGRWRDRQPAPIVHLHGIQPQGIQPYGMTTIQLGILLLQLALVVTLVMVLFSRAENASHASASSTGEVTRMLAEAKSIEQQVQTQLAVLDRIIAKWESNNPQVASELAEAEVRQQELQVDLRAERTLVSSLDRQVADLRKQLAQTQVREQRATTDLADLQTKFQALAAQHRELQAKVTGKDTDQGMQNYATIGIWSLLGLLMIASIGLLVVLRRRKLLRVSPETELDKTS